jgi:hypothetical protein
LEHRKKELEENEDLEFEELVILIYGFLVVDTPGFGRRQAKSWEDASYDKI